jgi:hypothetical protein
VIQRKGPWRHLEAVEFATLSWVDRFTGVDSSNRSATCRPSSTRQEIASAYLASGRRKEFGLYLMAVADTTAAFCSTMAPPRTATTVRETFLAWQRHTVNALAREIVGDRSGADDETLGQTSKEFAEALAALREAALRTA